MAFGFFKKKTFADVIYQNGLILTLDPDFPEAEAVAVKDGQVLSLGDADEIAGLKNDDTEIIDLEGATLVPGFFTADGTPVNDVFSHFACRLDPKKDPLAGTKEYITGHPKYGMYFCFGFDPAFDFGEVPVQTLDALTKKPLVLLSEGGDLLAANKAAMDYVHKALWHEVEEAQKAQGIRMVPMGNNSAADSVLRTKTEEGIDVEAAAEADAEEDRSILAIPVSEDNPWPLFRDILPGFQFFHRNENDMPNGLIEGAAMVSQFLNLLDFFDPEAVTKAVAEVGCELAKRGYTAVLDSGAPDYFVRMFLSSAVSLTENGALPVRFVLTNLVSRETDVYLSLQRIEQRKTLCTDCESYVAPDSVRFVLRGEETSNLSPEFLTEYAVSCGEHGFDILAAADGSAAVKALQDGLGSARENTRKALMVARIDSFGTLSEEEKTALLSDLDTAGIPVMGVPKTTGQKLNVLAGRCAKLLRSYEAYGAIVADGPADFTVLAENPLDGEKDPLSVPVLYTVLDGYTVSTDPKDYKPLDLEEAFLESESEEE